jgi:hypothetical protein
MDSLTGSPTLHPAGPTSGGQGAGAGPDTISDEELTALALSPDLLGPLDDDALPISAYLASQPARLPEWYMPMASTRARRWRWPIVLPVVFAFLLIGSFGLCATYGTLGIG